MYKIEFIYADKPYYYDSDSQWICESSEKSVTLQCKIVPVALDPKELLKMALPLQQLTLHAILHSYKYGSYIGKAAKAREIRDALGL